MELRGAHPEVESLAERQARLPGRPFGRGRYGAEWRCSRSSRVRLEVTGPAFLCALRAAWHLEFGSCY